MKEIYNTEVPNDECVKIVDSAINELHAFEKVEFDKDVFDNAPRDIESKKSEISEPSIDMQLAK